MIKRLHSRSAVVALLLSAALLGGVLSSLLASAADVVDRIIATVNGHVILQSDWDEALCHEALLNNRTIVQFTENDRRAVLDRLIDQELLREQIKSADFVHATDAEVAARFSEARQRYPKDSAAWQALLARYHLSESDLRSHIRQQIDLMRLVDARLRPTVQIDSKSIEGYYRDQFVPQLKQAGASAVPLAEVSGTIRELLTQEKVSELLLSWLQTLRSAGEIRIPGVTPSTDPGVQSR